MSTTSTFVGVLQLYRYREFICGWGAACTETCIMFPAVKLIFRQQLHGVVFQEALHQLRTEGITRLYRGLLPPLIMRTSSRAVMYGMYDRYQMLLNCGTQHSIMSACFACAALFGELLMVWVLFLNIKHLILVQLALPKRSFCVHWNVCRYCYRRPPITTNFATRCTLCECCASTMASVCANIIAVSRLFLYAIHAAMWYSLHCAIRYMLL